MTVGLADKLVQTVSENIPLVQNAASQLGDLTPDQKHQMFIGKMISIPLMFFIILGSALLPYVLTKLGRAKMIISFATCLSAGAMLGIGLVHCLPEAREVWEKYYGHDHDHDHNHDDHDDDHPHPHPHGHLSLTSAIALSSGENTVTLFPSIESVESNTVHNSKQQQLTRRYVDDMIRSGATLLGVDGTLVEHTLTTPNRLTHGGEAEPYSWNEFLAGLCVLVLLCIEYLASAFLEYRGNNMTHSHGHSHGAGIEHDDDEETANSALLSHEHTHHHDTSVPNSSHGINSLLEDDMDDEPVLDAKTLKERTTRKRNVDAFISAMAICVHCIFNGMSLGASQESVSQFWTFFIATVSHKFVDGFSVGVPIYRAKLSFPVSLALFMLVAISCPVGVVIGYLATEYSGGSAIQAVIMSLSAGSFLFVACFEMLPAGLGSGNQWLTAKILFVFIGYGIVSLVGKWA